MLLLCVILLCIKTRQGEFKRHFSRCLSSPGYSEICCVPKVKKIILITPKCYLRALVSLCLPLDVILFYWVSLNDELCFR